MNILKPFWVWSAIIFMLLFFQGGVYGGEIRVTGQVNPGDYQWRAITRADNAKRGIDVVLTSSARIITNGEPFKLVASKLNVDPGSRIIAFKSSAASGADGRSSGDNGYRGTDGKRAGNISFDVHRLFGYLYIDARGQAGGRGGNGADGERGAKGTDEVERKENYDCRCKEVCVSWFLWCLKYKTKCDTCTRYKNIPATDGGDGGDGGDAGDGGDGGNAGDVTLWVRDHYEAYLSVIYRGGEAGQAGQPGKGGQRGEPGKDERRRKARRGNYGSDGEDASRGRPGNAGTVQIVSFAHLEKQRTAIVEKIQWLTQEIQRLKNKYPWVGVWYKNQSERPYKFFIPDIHAGPNSSKDSFRAFLNDEKLDLSQTEHNRLIEVRNDFLKFNPYQKIINSLEKQLTPCKDKKNALDQESPKRFSLSGNNHEFKNNLIRADNKLEPESCI